MSKKIKIAIADDHDRIREALKMQLEEYGFEVILEGNNGEVLIDKIKKSSVRPDLCIIDGNMPVMNGCQTIATIKFVWPKIKLIGFSLDYTNRDKMIENGADAFILKSSPPDLINKTIKKLFNPEET